ncbi:MAG: prefoldin subunit alpha [Candidatus Nitrosothermus koennekii]|nr:MAG: prefoldin subunit alpha [Candidatus Nitrosothermus koennekii]
MSMDERLQNMIAQLKSMEAYLNDLVTKEAAVVRLIEEGKLAAEALRGLTKSADVLMPVGMGVYVQSLIKDDAKFLVNVGAGISIEKKREDAIAFIENRLRELEAALNNITSQKQDIQLRMEQMRREANELVMQMQMQQQKQ